MCMVKQGKVLGIKKKKALVEVDGETKLLDFDGDLKRGDTVNVFKDLAFK